jgi:hypothetical protein
MDYFTKELISAIDKLRDQLQKHSEAIAENAKATDQQEYKPPEVRAILNFPESVQASKTAAQEGQKRYQNRNLIVAWLTLIALVVYAAITGLIYIASDKAANAAVSAAEEAKQSRLQSIQSFNATIEQFHLDQRAWIGVVAVRKIDFQQNPIDLGVDLANTGKTPAFNVKSRIVVKFIPKGEAVTITYLPIRLPNYRDTLFPGMVTTLRPTSTPPIPATIAEEVKSGSTVIYYYGWITYDDVFHQSHRTEFCLEKTPGGGSTCDKYNSAN